MSYDFLKHLLPPTFKPELTTISGLRQPVHTEHHFEVPFRSGIASMTSEQRPPVNNHTIFYNDPKQKCGYM